MTTSRRLLLQMQGVVFWLLAPILWLGFRLGCLRTLGIEKVV
jgi:hypothetical protein